MGHSPFDFLKEKNCTLTQSNLRILKLQAQKAQKSGNEGIRAAAQLAAVALCLCTSLTASRWMLRACCWPAGPQLLAMPSHQPVLLSSCAGRGTAPVKGGVCNQVAKDCQCMCTSWHNSISLMQSACVLPATQGAGGGWDETRILCPVARGSSQREVRQDDLQRSLPA